MTHSREQEAISAYFKLLEKKGAKSGMLYKRSLFLDQFIPLLQNQALERTSYSKAIEKIIKTLPADIWHDSLNTAREFYPFWMQDIKAIAAFSRQGGFDIQPLKWQPEPTTLKALTDRLNTAKFNVTETRLLTAYTKALKDKGANPQLLDNRVNLAKILLLQLKGAPTDDARVYRVGVDMTLPLFKIDENKQLFLLVIREFYQYWIDNPDKNLGSDQGIEVTFIE
ncbi:hypothetical protein C3Y98_07030 [Methylotenera oryzisoli]|jgi:hypothetical protein|uniref:Uncharacterized protein n=1 Tax=Methylotenera oryzisoli TaxID=2080758 RepID=A0A4Y9VT95_9PROT|nr:hypothetical protein [Methylotenera oryzisoli]TFW71831.1 hypothetical protein C3Y98_07030 [Methylotenera oryzisoli]